MTVAQSLPVRAGGLVGPKYDLKNAHLNGTSLPARPPAAVNRYPAMANALKSKLVTEGLWNQGDFVAMGLGDCTIPLPSGIMDAYGRRLRTTGDSPYTPIQGLPEVRSGLATVYSSVMDVAIASDHISLTPGSRSAVDMFIRALSRQFPDLRTLVAVPTWATFQENAWRACGRNENLVAHELPKHFQLGYSPLNAEILDRQLTDNPDIKCVIIVNPHNPLGFVLDSHEARAIAGVLAKHEVFLLEDGTYWPMVYGGRYASILTGAFEHSNEARDKVLSRSAVIMGLQKLAMSGERVSSFVVPNPKLHAAILPELTAGHGATNRGAQELALAVYSDTELVQYFVAELQARRHALARAIELANQLFRQRLSASNGHADPSEYPDLISAYSIRDAADNPSALGGGFYTVVRFSPQALKMIPAKYLDEQGQVGEPTLLTFLIEKAGVIVQPGATTLLTDPGVVRLSYGAASVDDINKVPSRLVDAFCGPLSEGLRS